MVFKRTALFFLTLASAILLLHSIIPHSHDHLIEVSHSHDHTHGDAHHQHDTTEPFEDNHEQEGKLADVLSIISHSAEGITFINAPNLKNNTVSNQLIAFTFLVLGNFGLNDFVLTPLAYYYPEEFLECTSFHPCTNALRGPPAIAL